MVRYGFPRTIISTFSLTIFLIGMLKGRPGQARAKCHFFARAKLRAKRLARVLIFFKSHFIFSGKKVQLPELD